MNSSESAPPLVDNISHVAHAGAAQSMLGFESGDDCWLVDLADAGEVLPVPALTEVPLTQPWFLGIANIRGTLYSVSDLAAFHGAVATPIRTQSRLLLAGARTGLNVALLMSRTLGIKSLASVEPLTDDDGATQSWRGQRYRDADGRVWTHLLLPALLSAPQFLDIAA